MPRERTIGRWLVVLVTLVLPGCRHQLCPLPSSAAEREVVRPTEVPDEDALLVRVVSARVLPTRVTGELWDDAQADVTGVLDWVDALNADDAFPALGNLGRIPFRHRPDPYVQVIGEEGTLATSDPDASSFLPFWGLTFSVPRNRTEGTLRFVVLDRDARVDEVIGTATVEMSALTKRRGTLRVEGTGRLSDLTVHVLDPAKREARRPTKIRFYRIRIQVRKARADGSAWDAPSKGGAGYPGLLSTPEDEVVEGEDEVALGPDLVATLGWREERLTAAGRTEDEFVLDLGGLVWDVEGWPEGGDALVVSVSDEDDYTAEPIGMVVLPLATFVAAEASDEHVVSHAGDERNGILRVQVWFTLPKAASEEGAR